MMGCGCVTVFPYRDNDLLAADVVSIERPAMHWHTQPSSAQEHICCSKQMALALDSANLSCTRLLQYAELCTFEEISVSTLGGHLCTVHSQPDWFGRDLKASQLCVSHG